MNHETKRLLNKITKFKAAADIEIANRKSVVRSLNYAPADQYDRALNRYHKARRSMVLQLQNFVDQLIRAEQPDERTQCHSCGEFTDRTSKRPWACNSRCYADIMGTDQD